VEAGGTTRDKPQDIIIFMVGGTTYEEAKLIAQVNASTPGVRVVLGGTSVLNSKVFMDVSLAITVSIVPDGGANLCDRRLTSWP